MIWMKLHYQHTYKNSNTTNHVVLNKSIIEVGKYVKWLSLSITNYVSMVEKYYVYYDMIMLRNCCDNCRMI